MAAKSNQTRYRRIRSGILTASILAVLPVMGFLRTGIASNASASTTAQTDTASIQPSASANPATTSSSSQSSQSSRSTASAPVTHTRTRAS